MLLTLTLCLSLAYSTTYMMNRSYCGRPHETIIIRSPPSTHLALSRLPTGFIHSLGQIPRRDTTTLAPPNPSHASSPGAEQNEEQKNEIFCFFLGRAPLVTVLFLTSIEYPRIEGKFTATTVGLTNFFMVARTSSMIELALEIIKLVVAPLEVVLKH